MLEIKSVTWRNFLSYGDYDTTIDIPSLGQCLITGKVVDDDTRESYDNSNPVALHRSNGAGKSSCLSAIQWGLFGRTMHSANPGNKVINYFTGKDCRVTIEFKNGNKITRTRNTSGHNELFYIKQGDEHKLEASTISTSKNQQAMLAKEFGLDWEVFCGSVFFNQYGKPWMEMADQSRKKAIERILHIDRFEYYSSVAKEKHGAIETQIQQKKTQIATLQSRIEYIDGQVQRIQHASDNFEQNKKERQLAEIKKAVEEKRKRDAIVLPDLNKLQDKWNLIAQIESKVDALRQESNATLSQISRERGTQEQLQAVIQKWEQLAGRICTQCEQEIPQDHTASKVEPLHSSLEETTGKLSTLTEKRQKLQSTIQKTEQLIQAKRPDMTMADARRLHQSWEQHNAAISQYKSSADRIAAETNPHGDTIQQLSQEREQSLINIQTLEEEIERYDFSSRHHFYIHKAYSDRTKLKSFVFQDHIPFINSRLHHYLDVFDLDIKIELTKSLGITSNMWGYDFESGGERKRTDVAFMLAMFDFHEEMYGRQCNLLVLDEVDGRLDDDGIDALINVIKNDLAPKVESILIISHRGMMFDTFPNELCVVRSGRFSQLLREHPDGQ